MYKMSSLSLVVDAETESEETVHVVGAVNPGGSRTQKTIPKRPDPYDPAPRTIAQVWNDCLLKNRFHGSETPAEAGDRVLKAKHRLVAEGRLLPNLDAVLAHDGGLSPRPFVSVVNEDAHGGHTVLKHVRGGGVVADEVALATRVLLGIPPPHPVDVASYFVSTDEANMAVGLVLGGAFTTEWRSRYRDQLARDSGTQFVVNLGGNVGYGVCVNTTAGVSPGDKPSYMPGGTYAGPMYDGDPRAANPALPPMTKVVALHQVLVTIETSATAPGGWYVLRAYPQR
jgi:hypothetical protein